MKTVFTRDYFLLWLGLSVSRLGDRAGFIGIMWWVQEATGSVMALSMVAVAETVPRVLLGPFSGVAADRVNRKAIIVYMDVIRGLVYLLLAYMAYGGTLQMPLLLGLLSLSGAASQFFGPAVQSAVPQLVASSLLERANSLNQMTGTLVAVLGSAFGGIAVALFGVPALLLLNAASFLLSAVSEAFIRLQWVRREEPMSWRGVIDDLNEGWHYIMDQPVLKKIVQSSAVLNFFYPPIFVLMPMFVAEDMASGPEIYGYLLSVMSLGSLLALLVISVSSLVHRHVRLVIYGVVIQGLLLLAFALAPPRLVIPQFVALFAFGFLNALVNIFLITVLQRTTDPEHMGKAFGIMDTVSGTLQPLGQAAAGTSAAVVGIRGVYTLCGAAIGVGGKIVTSIPGLASYILEGSGAQASTVDGSDT